MNFVVILVGTLSNLWGGPPSIPATIPSILLSLLPASSARAQDPPAPIPLPPLPRQPIPVPEKVREADTLLRKAFPIDQARSPKERSDLARTLLTTAVSSQAKDADLWVMLRQARDLAISALDLNLALVAIERRVSTFEIDGYEEKIDLFSKVSPKGPDAIPWAREALIEGRAAAYDGQYDSAIKLAVRAETLAKTGAEKTLQETARECAKEFQDLKRISESLKVYTKTLEAKPDDPEASLAWGRYLCLSKGNWKVGLPKLLKGPDFALRALAERELANPVLGPARLELGEAWLLQAEKESPAYRRAALIRGAAWLQRAIPDLSGLAKINAERRLSSLGPIAMIRSQESLDLGPGMRMDLVYIGPGKFQMGGREGPSESWQTDERPLHEVRISKEFYLGKHEVTRGQFGTFVSATGYTTDAEKHGKGFCLVNGKWVEMPDVNWRNPKTFIQSDDHPVIFVSWNDAMAFCEWLGKRNGKQVRLPTEAEWEYACRAGSATRWSSGDEESALNEFAWTGRTSGMQTRPVGSKRGNPWNLYDMHGNVWEWCWDWSGPYGGKQVDPEGPSQGQERCLRGGSWLDAPIWCRSGFRNDAPPSSFGSNNGFRVVMRP